MADITSAISKMNDVELNAEAPVTEATCVKIGANINALIDDIQTSRGAASNATVSTGTLQTHTVLSLAVTLAAGDAVRLQLGANGSSFAGGSFTGSVAAAAADAIMRTVTIAWKRDATTLQTKSASGTTMTTHSVTASGTFIDKPGAGTYTYTFIVTTSYAGAGAVTEGYSGFAAMDLIES
jgi:hypothetical protein